MKETIKWSQTGPRERTAIVELCGWRNKKGNATPMGKKIARTEWNKLPPAGQNILSRHGVNP